MVPCVGGGIIVCACPGDSGLVWERRWVGVRATWEGTSKAGACFVTGADEFGRVVRVPSGGRGQYRVCVFGREAPSPRARGPLCGVGDALRIRVRGNDGIDPLDGLFIDPITSLSFCPARLGGVGFTSDRVTAFPIHVRGHPGPRGAVCVEGYEDNVCAREPKAVDSVFD